MDSNFVSNFTQRQRTHWLQSTTITLQSNVRGKINLDDGGHHCKAAGIYWVITMDHTLSMYSTYVNSWLLITVFYVGHVFTLILGMRKQKHY